MTDRCADHTRPLTAKQRCALAFIIRYTAEHGYAPTLREMCTDLGFVSTNNAQGLLKVLAAKGYVLRTLRQARSLKVIRGLDGASVAAMPPPNASVAEMAKPHLDALGVLRLPEAAQTMLTAIRQMLKEP